MEFDIDDDHDYFKFLSPFIIYYYISISMDAHGDTGIANYYPRFQYQF